MKKKMCVLCRHLFPVEELRNSHHGKICHDCFEEKSMSRYKEEGT